MGGQSATGLQNALGGVFTHGCPTTEVGCNSTCEERRYDKRKKTENTQNKKKDRKYRKQKKGDRKYGKQKRRQKIQKLKKYSLTTYTETNFNIKDLLAVKQ